jgi:hypothetical protein
MQTTTAVSITSSHVRRIVTFALWRIVATDVVGETELSDGYYDRAWGEINRIYMLDGDAGRAEFLLVRLAALTAAVRAVGAAAEGQDVELPVAPDEVAEALRDCVRAIDLNGDLLLALPSEEREDVLRCRRTALRLLRSLGARSPVGTGLASGSDLALMLPRFTLVA